MNTHSSSSRVQTAFRLKYDLVERLKRQAKALNSSLNNYVEMILIRATEPDFPKIQKGYQISEETRNLCGFVKTIERPTDEEMSNNPKLARIWNKYFGE